MTSHSETDLRRRVATALRELGADEQLPARRGLPLFEDAIGLVVAHVSRSGREHFLVPDAAAPWQRMRQAAAEESVELVMISGFRSFDRQLGLIRDRVAGGEPIAAVLEILAPAGCSEHHTGRAVDVGTPGCAPLSERFEDTAAFRWLRANAGGFGFRMSYPRGNAMGYRYEPWHWCHSPGPVSD